MNVGRWALAVGVVAVLAAVVVGALGDLGVGLRDVPLPADHHERAIALFEAHEERFMKYGRWEYVAVGVAFGSVLVAAPFLEAAARARHVVTAGAGIVVVASVVALSQSFGIDVARFGLDAGMRDDFVVGNMYRLAIGRTAAMIEIAGYLVTGCGILIVATDAKSRRWRAANAGFGVALVSVGITQIVGHPWFVDLALYTTAVIGLAWLVLAVSRTSRFISDAAEGGERGSA